MLEDFDDSGKVLWLVKDIPRNISELSIGASGVSMPEGSVELQNSFGYNGYAGPCPFNETHLFRFRLFSMNTPTTDIVIPSDLSTLTASFVESQISERAIYCSVLNGYYYAPDICPVVVYPGQPCPCPGVNCPIENFGKIYETGPIPQVRYVKPSEGLRPHTMKVNETTFNAIDPIINQDVLHCQNNTISDRAQIEEAAEPIFPVIPRSAGNLMVEDVPMPMEEQKKRRIKNYTWGLVPDVSLVQMKDVEIKRENSEMNSEISGESKDSDQMMME